MFKSNELIEKLYACAAADRHSKSIAIFDLRGVSSWELLGVAKSLKPKIGDFKPFMTHLMFGLTWRTYVVNAPTGFSAVWSIIKRFLDPVVQRKVGCCVRKSDFPQPLGGTVAQRRGLGASRVHTTRRVRSHFFSRPLDNGRPAQGECDSSPPDVSREESSLAFTARSNGRPVRE